ncbi:MAG: glycosyltransferase family protein [Bradymonadaceae bacterium]
MRILYGIAGDGLGHAVRSAVIIEQLKAQGHDIQIVVSDEAADYLAPKFPDLTEIWGLSLETQGNEVSPARTVASNVRRGLAPSGLPRNIYKCFDVARSFDPDVVISDHELWSWFFATLNDIPLVGLDNIHLLSRCDHPPEIMHNLQSQYPLEWLIVKNRVPSAQHYLVSSFARPEPTEPDTTLIPPVLRNCILEADPTDEGHLVVYQTSYSQVDLIGMLRNIDRPVYVFGSECRRRIDNVRFRPFNEHEFIERLATCRAVVGSAGFTLMTEALHLGKPYFAIPVEGQIEQMLNARYLAWLGYGEYAKNPDRPALERFLERVPQFKDALERYDRFDNEPTFEKLETLLERHTTRPELDHTDTRALRAAE